MLLERLTEIHAEHYGYEKNISYEQIHAFMEIAVNQMGADTLLTPREVSRDFLGLLNILQQDSSMTFEGVIGVKGFTIKSEAENADEAVDEYADLEI